MTFFTVVGMLQLEYIKVDGNVARGPSYPGAAPPAVITVFSFFILRHPSGYVVFGYLPEVYYMSHITSSQVSPGSFFNSRHLIPLNNLVNADFVYRDYTI